MSNGCLHHLLQFIIEFLAHAATIHKYDVQIKLQHLPPPQKETRVMCSDTSSVDGSDASLKSDDRSTTETPASSVGFEMENFDPRLIGIPLHHHHETSIESVKEIAIRMMAWEGQRFLSPGCLQVHYNGQLY